MWSEYKVHWCCRESSPQRHGSRHGGVDRGTALRSQQHRAKKAGVKMHQPRQTETVGGKSK
jgi:hypothetical protein